MKYGDAAGQPCLAPLSIPYLKIIFCFSQARVYTTENDERLQKKQRQEAIMAQFKAKYDLSKIFNSRYYAFLNQLHCIL
jgi:hypothetical protein